jgi:hypothetical protein
LNLGLLLRTLCGLGTPRALQGRLCVLLGCLWALSRLPQTIRTPLWTLLRPSASPQHSRAQREVRELTVAAATPFTAGC